MKLFDALKEALRPRTFPEWLTERTVSEPGWRYDWPYMQLLFERLDRVTRGETKRLLVAMPPRHAKTSTVAIRYAAWRLERDPRLRIITAGYSHERGDFYSLRIRRLMEQRGVPLAPDLASISEWETAGGGGVKSAGVGSGITGRGADLIVIDDPVKSREEADSLTMRERLWDWYTNDCYTRLEPGGSIVLIQTRWHHDDLAGRLLAAARDGGEEWDVLSLPALSMGEGDPLGRPEGEALCPDRYPVETLEAIKTTIGLWSFESLYQQNPIPREGALLRPDLIQHTDHVPAGLRVVQAWDLAISTKQTADYSVCATVGADRDGNAHILHVWRRRVAFNALVNEMGSLAETWKPTVVGIETVAFQAAAFQEATRRHMQPFRAITRTADKLTRAQLLAARIDAGRVFANKKAPWWPALEAELATFPGGRHDDQADALGDCVGLLRGGTGEVFAGTRPSETGSLGCWPTPTDPATGRTLSSNLSRMAW